MYTVRRLFNGDLMTQVTITGCAVAQHCYNGDVRFLWEKLELWPPVKFKTLKQIVTKFVTVDYIHEGNVRSKFGKRKNPLTVDFWANRWNVTFLWLFFIFFLRHAQRSNPLTDFDAWWLKMRGITQRCTLWVLKYLMLCWLLAGKTTIKIIKIEQ